MRLLFSAFQRGVSWVFSGCSARKYATWICDSESTLSIPTAWLSLALSVFHAWHISAGIRTYMNYREFFSVPVKFCDIFRNFNSDSWWADTRGGREKKDMFGGMAPGFVASFKPQDAAPADVIKFATVTISFDSAPCSLKSGPTLLLSEKTSPLPTNMSHFLPRGWVLLHYHRHRKGRAQLPSACPASLPALLQLRQLFCSRIMCHSLLKWFQMCSSPLF